MTRHASGKYAYGFCDRTGQRWPLHMLKEEYVQGVPTGLRVGPDVWDDDHPQNWVGMLGDYSDAQSLENPRPDLAKRASQSVWGWNPVGSVGLEVRTGIGRVTTS